MKTLENVRMTWRYRLLNKIQSRIRSPLAARALFYPTLLLNVLTVLFNRKWRWYNRIDNNVVLGALPFRFQTEKLVHEENVVGIVSLNEKYEMKYLMHSTEELKKMGIMHLCLETPDFNNAPDLEKLLKGVAFVSECSSRGSVYVHCKAGRGRSVTLVACYLMKVVGMSPEEAVRFLKRKRIQTLLGSRQEKAIHEFHESIQENEYKSRRNSIQLKSD